MLLAVFTAFEMMIIYGSLDFDTENENERFSTLVFFLRFELQIHILSVLSPVVFAGVLEQLRLLTLFEASIRQT